MSNSVIKVYTTTWCADCRRTKLWLLDHHVPFEEINIEQDEKAVEYVQEVNHGMHSVPTIVFPDGSTLTEPSNMELEEKVKSLNLMPDKKQSIIFVYNANSSLFSQIADYAHKIISSDTYKCNLCKLTYGNLGMKKEWKNFIQRLPYRSIFLHKDEFVALYPQVSNTSFPAIFRLQERDITELVTSNEINKQHTISELEKLVQSKVK